MGGGGYDMHPEIPFQAVGGVSNKNALRGGGGGGWIFLEHHNNKIRFS